MDKYKLDKSAQIVENSNYIMTQEEVCERLNDLEAKLAESEHRNEQLVDALNGEVFINYKLPMENAQLKQQLAEKEEETTERMMKFERECQEYYKHKEFTIEKLQEVKKSILNLNREEYFKRFYELEDMEISRNDVVALIENQIKQLTHQHEDKGE